jgi:predicted TIM-barrel fold metal-dependent hydrolase
VKHFESLEIIDCNTFLGHYAFRRLRSNDVPGLLAMMNDFGIERVCVASAEAILYRDCQSGNEKLYEDTRAASDRFTRYATINPAYAGWQRDLTRCVDLGFKALRLYPAYHGYDVDGPEAVSAFSAAAEAGLPVSLPVRVEDPRQHHRLDTAADLDLRRIVGAAEACPQAVYVITEAIVRADANDQLWPRLRALNIYFEISRMTSVLDKDLQALFEHLGAERLLFGTGFPFKTPSPAFLKLQALDASQEEKGRIAGGNARRLFK